MYQETLQSQRAVHQPCKCYSFCADHIFLITQECPFILLCYSVRIVSDSVAMLIGVDDLQDALVKNTEDNDLENHGNDDQE
jgi:hypothetical protein